jgi:hypothetical protein
MKTSLFFLCVLLTFLMTTTTTAHNPVLANPENWSEVTRFTGAGSRQSQNTTYFTVDHAEWRIQWGYTPNADYAAVAGFIVYVYPPGEAYPNYTVAIFDIGGNQTNGTSYVHNQTGTFYMSVTAVEPAIINYTIIVEQDLDSVPEFPSPTLIPFTLTAALLTGVVVAYRKQRSKRV